MNNCGDDTMQNNMHLSNNEKNGKRCFFLISNRNYFFALCVLIRNINKFYPNYMIVVLEDGSLTSSDKKIIIDIKKSTEFITCTKDDFCKKYNVNINSKSAVDFIEHYSHLQYLKFEIFNLLEQYDTVMYLDLDIIIKQNIDELFELECDISWRNGVTLLNKMRSILDRKLITLKSLEVNVDDKTQSLNGGLIIVNKSFNFRAAHAYSVEILRKLIDIQGSMIDEIIISLACSRFGLNLIALDPEIYNVHPQYSTIGTKIIHFFGAFKPWSHTALQIFYRDWIDNYLYLNEKYKIESDNVKVVNNYGECIVQMHYVYMSFFKLFTNNIFYKILNELQTKLEIDDNKIIFVYSINLYYQIQYFMDSNKYIISLNINGYNAINSNLIIEETEQLVRNIIGLKKKTLKNSIYIYTDKFSQEQVLRGFYFIYKNSARLRRYL